MQKLATILSPIPPQLTAILEATYLEVKRAFVEGRYEPSELNAAKFCEITYRILEWHTSGTFTPFNVHISNFGGSLKKFEPLSKFSDSVRFHIPKVLDALYTIRNKRGVGHLGSEVNPNFMDSQFVVSGCDWIMAELIRLFHNVGVKKANAIVSALVVKKIPLVWEVDNKKRVLNPGFSYRAKALLLLYEQYPEHIREGTLCEWVEHSNPTVFRRDVIIPLHKQKLCEYDSRKRTVTLSPLGVAFVDNNIPMETELGTLT